MCFCGSSIKDGNNRERVLNDAREDGPERSETHVYIVSAINSK
jgi:hypothetical protein